MPVLCPFLIGDDEWLADVVVAGAGPVAAGAESETTGAGNSDGF